MSAAQLQIKVLYGLTTNISGNGHYITDYDVLYPVGNVLAIHNFAQHRQRILNLSPDKRQINIIAITPNRKFAALCETSDNKPSISIYDLQSLRRKKALGVPYEIMGVTKFACISFSFDNRYLAAVTDKPDQMMLFYNWEKGKVESSLKLSQNESSTISCIACNPGDLGILAVAGNYSLKLLTVSETVWRPYGFTKANNLLISCISWLNTERLLAGTRDGRILYLENGDLKNIYKMSDTILMNLKIREDFILNPTASETTLQNSNDIPIIVSYPRGFAFAFGPRTVIIFARDGQHKYLKSQTFVVPSQVSTEIDCEDRYNINTISVNVSYDRLLVTTGWPQIFCAKLHGETSQTDAEERQNLEVLGQQLHNGSICGLSMCAWKSVFLTCGSTDRSVRLWDYESENLIMMKQYMEDLFCVSLHPIGHFCLIGFTDKLRFLTILANDFLPTQEFPIRKCCRVSFSHGGHMFAAVNGNVIHIYCTIRFSSRYLLKGHTGQIRDVVWSQSDMSLLTIASEGAVYVWNMSSGLRTSEVIVKDVSLVSIALGTDDSTAFCITSTRDSSKLREIRNNTTVREYSLNKSVVTSIITGKMNSFMFFTCPGGSILSVKCPLQEPAEFQDYQIHSVDVTCMALALNEKILVSTAKDGSLCFWKIINSDSSVDLIKSNNILIGKNDLEMKEREISDLNVRLRELDAEQKYKMRQIDVQTREKIRDIHQGYGEAIDQLKMRIDQLNHDRSNELNAVNLDIARMKLVHEKTIQEMESSYNSKLIVEYDKFVAFEEQTSLMKKEYEEKLQTLVEKHEKEKGKMIENFKEEIFKKNLQLNDLEKEMAHHIRIHEKIKSQIEEDAEREILEIRSKYQNELYNERQLTLQLKGDSGVLRNRYSVSQKIMDDLKRQINHFRTEQNHYQKAIQNLERNILDLKTEIKERDVTIQEREKQVHDLQRHNQELEKFKFVLNYKIEELNSQIEPKDKKIQNLEKQIQEMEIELMNFHKNNNTLELKLNETHEKLFSLKNQVTAEHKNVKYNELLLKKIRTDLANAVSFIQEPQALKTAVKQLYQRYSADDKFLTSRREDLDAQCEFRRQRDRLEKTVDSLRKHTQRKPSPMRFHQIDRKRLLESLTTFQELLVAIETLIHQLRVDTVSQIAAEELNPEKILNEHEKIILKIKDQIMKLSEDLKSNIQ